MKVEYHALALAELTEARDWYEKQSRGLGAKFIDEYEQALQLALCYPLLCKSLTPDLRRFLLKKFPYQAIFAITAKQFLVLAVAHTHRRPNYWVDRIHN